MLWVQPPSVALQDLGKHPRQHFSNSESLKIMKKNQPWFQFDTNTFFRTANKLKKLVIHPTFVGVVSLPFFQRVLLWLSSTNMALDKFNSPPFMGRTILDCSDARYEVSIARVLAILIRSSWDDWKSSGTSYSAKDMASLGNEDDWFFDSKTECRCCCSAPRCGFSWSLA